MDLGRGQLPLGLLYQGPSSGLWSVLLQGEGLTAFFLQAVDASDPSTPIKAQRL